MINTYLSLFRKMLMSAYLLRFKVNYLAKMHGYPSFSLWILVALSKNYFFRVVRTWRENLGIQQAPSLSGKTAITNPKVARSLVERQLRNRLQGWPAFFVSSVRWRTGHWIRKLTRQSKSRFSQGTPPRNNIDYNADLWHASRKSFLNMLCKYREIVNCQTRARYSRKQFRSQDSMREA